MASNKKILAIGAAALGTVGLYYMKRFLKSTESDEKEREQVGQEFLKGLENEPFDFRELVLRKHNGSGREYRFPIDYKIPPNEYDRIYFTIIDTLQYSIESVKNILDNVREDDKLFVADDGEPIMYFSGYTGNCTVKRILMEDRELRSQEGGRITIGYDLYDKDKDLFVKRCEANGITIEDGQIKAFSVCLRKPNDKKVHVSLDNG